jgi:hypothetical protein
MNEYIKLIIDNLDVSYLCSVMLLGYMITKSRLSTKIKIKTRWIILLIGIIVAIFYYFVIKIRLDVLFFSFVTAQFLNLYVSEYLIDYLIKKLGSLTKKTNEK